MKPVMALSFLLILTMFVSCNTTDSDVVETQSDIYAHYEITAKKNYYVITRYLYPKRLLAHTIAGAYRRLFNLYGKLWYALNIWLVFRTYDDG